LAEVSLDTIRNVRRNGGVLNHAHWPEQIERLTQPASRRL
jgi:hypothetical protein